MKLHSGMTPGFTESLSSLRRRTTCWSLLVFLSAFLMAACSGAKLKPVEKKTVEELLDDIANGANDQIRAAAVRQLGARKDGVALTALTVALKDESVRVRAAAVSALGETQDPKAAETLWAVIKDPLQSRALTISAARALAQLGDARAAEPLVQALPTNRAEASAALLVLGKPAIPPLIEAIRGSATRSGASAVLVSMGALAVDPLIEVLREDQSKYARYAAASVLAEIEDDRASAALNEALKQPDPELTRAVYRFLIRRGKPGSEPQLISVLATLGVRAMAEDFVSSGNPALKNAGEAWLRKSNEPPTMRLSELPEVHWAGVDPSLRQVALFHFDNSLASTSGIGPVQTSGVSFVAGKWGAALSVGQGGMLRYPVKDLLNFNDGTIEMWIAPRFDGADPIYTKYDHPLLLYASPKSDQFLVSEGRFAGFYAGTVIRGKFTGAGGGSLTSWKSGTWHHVAFTYSSRAERQRLYLDGTLAVENHGRMPPPDAGQAAFTFGCDPYAHWTAFSIDELLISSAAKDPDAVRNSARRAEPFR